MYDALARLKPQVNRGTAFLLIVLVTVAAIPSFSVWVLSEFLDLHVSKASAIVGSVGTLIAICVGGVFAVYQFRLFRHNEPHLSVKQSVTHHPVSNGYVAIVVSAELLNSSKVAVRIRETLFRVQQFGQFTDEKVEELYSDTFINQNDYEIQWPTLDEIRSDRLPGEIVVEPGEAHTETYEFIVAEDLWSVMVYSMFYNPNSSTGDEDRRGWHATTVCNMSDEEKNVT